MSGRRPRIGISSYPRSNSRLANREVFPLPTSYVEAVRAAGAVALILPPGESDPGRLLDGLDGIVLSGGGDISPHRYSGNAHDSIYGVSEERDHFEIELARAAVARPDLPFLCICRGMGTAGRRDRGTRRLVARLGRQGGRHLSHLREVTAHWPVSPAWPNASRWSPLCPNKS